MIPQNNGGFYDDEHTIRMSEESITRPQNTVREESTTKPQAKPAPRKSRAGAVLGAVAAGVGGATAGAALGAGAVLLTSATPHPDEHEVPTIDHDAVEDLSADHIHEAHVSDDLSFSDAFAEARDQVGPHGVFEWHGQLYGTYLKDEWDNMSQEEHAAWSREVAQGDFREMPNPDNQPDYVAATLDDDETMEVEVIGVESITTDDGNDMSVGILNVEGTDVYVVDVDGDGVADVMGADLDGDGSLSDGEIYDVSSADLAMNDLSTDDFVL